MIVLDANVLIAFLDATDGHHTTTVGLLERHFVDGFASSVLTVAEALVHPVRAGRQDAAMTALQKVGVQILPIDASSAVALAHVRDTYSLRMPDAVALHAALTTGSDLATFDSAVISAAERAGVAIAD